MKFWKLKTLIFFTIFNIFACNHTIQTHKMSNIFNLLWGQPEGGRNIQISPYKAIGTILFGLTLYYAYNEPKCYSDFNCNKCLNNIYDNMYNTYENIYDSFTSPIDWNQRRSNIISINETLDCTNINYNKRLKPSIITHIKNEFFRELSEKNVYSDALEYFIELDATIKNGGNRLPFNQLFKNCLNKNKLFCIVQGPGGIGKTTSLINEALRILRQWNNKLIPIFIDIPYVYKKNKRALAHTRLLQMGLKKSEICSLQTYYQLLLIFDGFDEVPQLLDIKVNEKLSDYKNMQAIVSVRNDYISPSNESRLFDRSVVNTSPRIYISPISKIDQKILLIEKYLEHRKEGTDYEIFDSNLNVYNLLLQIGNKIDINVKQEIIPYDFLSLLDLLIEIKTDQRFNCNKFTLLEKYIDKIFDREANRIFKRDEIYDDEGAVKRRLIQNFKEYNYLFSNSMFLKEEKVINKFISGTINPYYRDLFDKSNFDQLIASPVITNTYGEYQYRQEIIKRFFIADAFINYLNNYKEFDKTNNEYISNKKLYKNDSVVYQLILEGINSRNKNIRKKQLEDIKKKTANCKEFGLLFQNVNQILTDIDTIEGIVSCNSMFMNKKASSEKAFYNASL